MSPGTEWQNKIAGRSSLECDVEATAPLMFNRLWNANLIRWKLNHLSLWTPTFGIEHWGWKRPKVKVKGNIFTVNSYRVPIMKISCMSYKMKGSHPFFFYLKVIVLQYLLLHQYTVLVSACLYAYMSPWISYSGSPKHFIVKFHLLRRLTAGNMFFCEGMWVFFFPLNSNSNFIFLFSWVNSDSINTQQHPKTQLTRNQQEKPK